MIQAAIHNKKSENQMLRQQRGALIQAFLEDRSPDFILAHSRIFDTYFRERYAASLIGPKLGPTRNPCAIIALGGYGRQEQCVHSDIDLLFLFEKRVPPVAVQLVEEVLFPLWDLGLDVGHVTRSIGDCLDEARSDLENLTAMLDARFICGMSPLFTALESMLRKNVWAGKSDQIIHQLVAVNRQRHRRFGDSAHLLQPNLKEGHGGLRDYHTLLWITRIQAGVRTRRDLEYHGCLSHEEYTSLETTLNFIWRVRNHLHLLTGRKNDQLYFEHQEKLAQTLGFTSVNGLRPVEHFLGELHAGMTRLKNLGEMFLYENDLEKRSGRISASGKRPGHTGLVIEKGMLNFSSPEEMIADPELLMIIFLESARLRIPLTPEAKRLVRDFSYLVDDDFRKSPDVVNAFERVLTTPSGTFNALSEMLDTELLIRFLPEFKNIHNRILYNAYHLYPVDRHSLRVVRALRSFNTADDVTGCRLGADLYKETPHKKLLCWAALLHDIAKGDADGHHAEKGAGIAEKVLTRMGMPLKGIEIVTFLIREHLFLIHTALRRDLQEEETAIFCARRVKSINRLKMLYLLSVADSAATSPKAWNDWTAVLLQDLFLKTAKILEKGELASGQATRMLERKRAAVVASSTTDKDRLAIAKIVKELSPRYMHYVPAKAIAGHIDLYRSLGDRSHTWSITGAATRDTRTVTICTRDHHGLFSKIAGVLTLNRIDILNAQIYTWNNRTALDIFEVTAPPDPIFEQSKWEKTGRDLEAALTGQLDLPAVLTTRLAAYRKAHLPGKGNPPRVMIDNESSSFFSLVEIYADDFPGLLFTVTDALYRSGLDIWIAKIATGVDEVVDVFYVRDFDGNKIDSHRMEISVKQAIIRAVTAVDDNRTSTGALDA
ncbi:MAG: [protein-PII] uridylyltransferase [Deltaproteobacteria bacterium]|nr:MAG: [protein-PII] uridylyltransferase [Deltaproteobacteria bacterium]